VEHLSLDLKVGSKIVHRIRAIDRVYWGRGPFVYVDAYSDFIKGPQIGP
jgi:hypothetical protein